MKKTTMQELDEKYKNAHEQTAVYEVNGVAYTVHFFVSVTKTSTK